MEAKIFDIQRNSFVDGPGIRTTVFFKGCNLKCRWCHNPESQSPQTEILTYNSRCVGCGRCVGITEKDTDFVCYHEAKNICGKDYTVDDLYEEIIKDKLFFDNSGGGVTFSGGECMLQIDFLEAILKKCKENGIHTAVDTAGHVPWEFFERCIPYTDLFLYDVKAYSDDLHIEGTGVTSKQILENLEKASKISDVIVRIPLIPGYNDGEAELRRIGKFLKSLKILQFEVLPYHKMGEHKYEALGRQGGSFSVPDEELIKNARRIISEA